MTNGKMHIRMIPSIKTDWGSFGLVQATLNGLQMIGNCGITFDRITLMSGQDYPIKSHEEIELFYAASPHCIFMDYSPLPNYKKWPGDGGLYRVTTYFWGFSWTLKYGARTINFLSLFFSLFRRRLKQKMKHYYGSQWWTIDDYALRYILNFINQRPDYLSFHRHTFAPDELFFQTILRNAPDSRITQRMANDNLVFIKWKHSSSAHPDQLSTADLKDITASKALFARKFDTAIDAEILNLIDQQTN